MRNKVHWFLRLFKWRAETPPSRRGLLSAQLKENEKKLNVLSSELSKKHDLIGPADKISNLRRYHYYIPENESRIEREYRIMREWVHEYNHQYWTEQNLRFVEAKRAFVEAHKRQQRIKNEEIKEPTTAEYNEFYKRFLNENYYNHYDYNQKWLRYNFALLWPACKVFLYRLFVKNNRVNKRLK